MRVPDHVYDIFKKLGYNISELVRSCLIEAIICDTKTPDELRKIILENLENDRLSLKSEIASLEAQLDQLKMKLEEKKRKLEKIENLIDKANKTATEVFSYLSMKHEQIQRDIERSFADIEYLLSRDDPDLKSKILARIDAIAQSNNVTSNVVLRLFWEKFRDKYPNLEAILF
ncbi:MAG: hypothetical protein DRQ41_13380 [Gammaproteobacteria bacterium]|nr:MAG: hypothetical protein DRQ41_13380 [Gammaproteobacteria bacterium]